MTHLWARLATDPMPGTPIVAVTSAERMGAVSANDQSYWVYYQQSDEAVQEVVYGSSSAGWGRSTTVLTDAASLTGLAAFTYLSDLEQTVGPSPRTCFLDIVPIGAATDA